MHDISQYIPLSDVFDSIAINDHALTPFNISLFLATTEKLRADVPLEFQILVSATQL